jgi:hypothetical protein
MIGHQSIQFLKRRTLDRETALPAQNLLPEFFAQVSCGFHGAAGPIRLSPLLNVRCLTRSEQISRVSAIVTVALGTTASVISVTVPRSVAFTAWEKTVSAFRQSARRIQNTVAVRVGTAIRRIDNMRAKSPSTEDDFTRNAAGVTLSEPPP